MNDLAKAKANHERINTVIGRTEPVEPNTALNCSRDRLLRVQAGLRHLLTNIVPGIANPADREEVFLWVDGIFTITQAEECAANGEDKA